MIDKNDPNDSFDRLMRLVITLLFVWLPISAKKLSKHIVLCHKHMKYFVENETLHASSICITE